MIPDVLPPPSPSPSPRRKSWALRGLAASSLLVAGSALAALTYRQGLSEARERESRKAEVAAGPRVRAIRATVAPGERTIALTGEVHAIAQTTLYAKVSGYVRELRVERGDQVRAGQVIARLESPEVEQQVESARAELELKRQELERHRVLVQSDFISRQQFDETRAAERVARAALSKAQATLAYSTLRAPFSGRVVARYVDPGALLSAATGTTQSAQPVIALADVERVRVVVFLGQEDAAAVHPGDPVVLTIDGRPELRVSATLTRVTGSLEPRTRTMRAEIELDNRQPQLLPGAFVHVGITVRSPPLPTVPSEALIVRGDRLFVALVDGGRAHWVPVETAPSDGERVRIRSGLAGGELVALGASTDAVDGAPVTVAAPR